MTEVIMQVRPPHTLVHGHGGLPSGAGHGRGMDRPVRGAWRVPRILVRELRRQGHIPQRRAAANDVRNVDHSLSI